MKIAAYQKFCGASSFRGLRYGVGFFYGGNRPGHYGHPVHHFRFAEVLLSVPRDQREAALALGSTRWESTWKSWCLRTHGHHGLDFLALARALGETMAVTMVIGIRPRSALRSSRPGIPSRR